MSIDVRVQVPSSAPARRKRHIACDEFFISLQNSSRAHFAAPRFQTGPAVAGLRFGAAAARRFCLPLKISILTVPSIKIATPAGCGYFYRNRGNLKCSAEVNSACAKIFACGENACTAQKRRRPEGRLGGISANKAQVENIDFSRPAFPAPAGRCLRRR